MEIIITFIGTIGVGIFLIPSLWLIIDILFPQLKKTELTTIKDDFNKVTGRVTSTSAVVFLTIIIAYFLGALVFTYADSMFDKNLWIINADDKIKINTYLENTKYINYNQFPRRYQSELNNIFEANDLIKIKNDTIDKLEIIIKTRNNIKDAQLSTINGTIKTSKQKIDSIRNNDYELETSVQYVYNYQNFKILSNRESSSILNRLKVFIIFLRGLAFVFFLFLALLFIREITARILRHKKLKIEQSSFYDENFKKHFFKMRLPIFVIIGLFTISIACSWERFEKEYDKSLIKTFASVEPKISESNWWKTKLSDFDSVAFTFNTFIEIPKNSDIKMEVDINQDRYIYDRRISKSYPFYYGCVPQTLSGDGDPLDVVVFSDDSTMFEKESIINCIGKGYLKMIDGGEIDYKIIGIPTHEQIADDTLNKKVEEAIEFFKTYKGKNSVKIMNDTTWADHVYSKEILKKDIYRWKELN